MKYERTGTMQTIKSGRDYTGFAIIKHKRCGASTRIALARVGNCHTLTVDEIVAINGAVRIGAKGWSKTREEWHVNDIAVACNGCGVALPISNFAPIYGRFVAEVVCNGKCMNATRESCDCSCGGVNHGGGHSLAAA